MRRYLIAAVAALVGVFLFPTGVFAAPNTVEICHFNVDDDPDAPLWELLEVSTNGKALAKHEAHGDGFPGDSVPGDDASIFDQDCNVVPFPTSCQEWRDADPVNNSDGDYVIESGQRFTVYCHDMAGTPAEYLTLVNTTDANFSQLTGGTIAPWDGPNVRTSYTKIRLDPATLLVDISDQTFSTSVGTQISPLITSMPYGVAASCQAAFTANGIANVDLTGTPFKVIDPFTPGAGFNAAGTAIKSASDQVVDLTGGGRCGFTTPEVSPGDTAGYRSPVNQGGGNNPPDSPPSFILDLAFL